MAMLRNFCRVNTLIKKCCDFYKVQKMCYSYEGDGKTTVTFLNRETDGHLIISAYNKLGFRLSSGLFVVGPVILFPRTILSWNVEDDNDISGDSLCLFQNLEPKIDLLVIGLSDAKNSFRNQSFFVDKIKSLKKAKLNFELLPTEKAIATYNFLCAENRFVAAALIPPKDVVYSEDDIQSFNIGNKLVGHDDYLLGDDCEVFEKADEKNNKKFESGKVRGPRKC